MKPLYQFKADGTDYRVVNHQVFLELFSPGRAILTVESKSPLQGVVTFAIGWAPNTMQFFVGYVESSVATTEKTQRVLCREITASLNRPLPIALRHVTLNQVLSHISDRSGLVFSTPATDYANQPTAHYYHTGGGYYALDAMAAAFNIDRFMWQVQGDGRVYVGAWDDSFWATKQRLELPIKELSGHAANRTAKLPMIPRLRPGVVALLQGKPVTITSVQLDEHVMTIGWAADPWSQRLKPKGAA